MSYEIFLGGHDLEMVEIGRLARKAGVPVHDLGLRWGARASAYATEIAAVRATGRTPVLVELPWDLAEPAEGVVLVDHHGAGAGVDQPSALRQVHQLLGNAAGPWTRWHELVQANDIGWIPFLIFVGASKDEIAQVRAADRQAQGVTAEEEAQAQHAVEGARHAADGRLLVVQSPHDRSAPITDRLHPALGGPAIDNVLLFGPREVQFFGDGRLVRWLADRYPGSWYGGALPERGYWGTDAGVDRAELESSVIQSLEQARGQR